MGQVASTFAAQLKLLLYDETDQRCRLLRDAEVVGIGKRVEKISYWGLSLVGDLMLLRKY